MLPGGCTCTQDVEGSADENSSRFVAEVDSMVPKLRKQVRCLKRARMGGGGCANELKGTAAAGAGGASAAQA